MLACLVCILAVVVGEPADPGNGLPVGRRDPFVRPGGGEPRLASCASTGLRGLRIEEVALRGTLVIPSQGQLAMLEAADGRSFFARVGEPLCDGHLAAIEARGVVFIQEVMDPLAPERAR